MLASGFVHSTDIKILWKLLIIFDFRVLSKFELINGNSLHVIIFFVKIVSLWNLQKKQLKL